MAFSKRQWGLSLPLAKLPENEEDLGERIDKAGKEMADLKKRLDKLEARRIKIEKTMKI
jgi:hypothetical protein